MHSLTVRVVDGDDRSIANERVTIFITHQFFPQTHLTEYTAPDGRACFSFDSGLSANVYVRGNLELDNVDPDGEVTVCI